MVGPRLLRILIQFAAMIAIPRRQQTGDECLAEIAEIGEILAAGLMRLMARKSSSILAGIEDSSLHISGVKSGHPTPVDRRTADD